MGYLVLSTIWKSNDSHYTMNIMSERIAYRHSTEQRECEHTPHTRTRAHTHAHTHTHTHTHTHRVIQVSHTVMDTCARLHLKEFQSLSPGIVQCALQLNSLDVQYKYKQRNLSILDSIENKQKVSPAEPKGVLDSGIKCTKIRVMTVRACEGRYKP